MEEKVPWLTWGVRLDIGSDGKLAGLAFGPTEPLSMQLALWAGRVAFILVVRLFDLGESHC